MQEDRSITEVELRLACRHGNLNVVKAWIAQNESLPPPQLRAVLSEVCQGALIHNQAQCRPSLYSPRLEGASGPHSRILSLLLEQEFANPDKVDEDGETLLHTLCREGGSLEIVRILAQYSDINALNHRNETPLLLAVSNGGSRSLIKVLLGAGADPNISTKRGETPWSACMDRTDFASLAEFFLQHKADPNATAERGWTPLHFAVRYWDVELAEILLEEYGAIPNLATTDLRETALHKACWMDSEPMVRLLLRHNANGNAVDVAGRTPLHCAFNILPIVRLLVEHGVDVNIADREGETPLFYCIRHNEPASGKFLVGHRHTNLVVCNHDGVSPLRLAVEQQHVWAVEALFQANVSVESATATGHLPILDLACSRGNPDIVRLLLTNDADTKTGFPLHVACQHVYSPLSRPPFPHEPEADKVVELLLKHDGQLVNALDEHGRSALHLACSRGLLSIVKRLASQGADLNIYGGEGCTPFELACQNGHVDILLYFFRRHNWISHLRS